MTQTTAAPAAGHRRTPTLLGQTFPSLVAALTAVGLGAIGAVLLIVGHHPWDGRVVDTLQGTSHGLHRGDVLSVIPASISVLLAWWCLRQGRRAGN